MLGITFVCVSTKDRYLHINNGKQRGLCGFNCMLGHQVRQILA